MALCCTCKKFKKEKGREGLASRCNDTQYKKVNSVSQDFLAHEGLNEKWNESMREERRANFHT